MRVVERRGTQKWPTAFEELPWMVKIFKVAYAVARNTNLVGRRLLLRDRSTVDGRPCSVFSDRGREKGGERNGVSPREAFPLCSNINSVRTISSKWYAVKSKKPKEVRTMTENVVMACYLGTLNQSDGRLKMKGTANQGDLSFSSGRHLWVGLPWCLVQ